LLDGSWLVGLAKPTTGEQEVDVTLQTGTRSLRILAVVAGLAAAQACGGSSSTSNPSPMPTPTPGGGTADVTITINGMQGSSSYSPSSAAVKVGQKVAWHNADSIAHTATGSGFDTGSIAGGGTSSPITITTAGTLDYKCSFHPSMVGSLAVTQ
jgi:plastocyanin